LHRPYASMNWIRFNGSLRHNRQSQIVQQYLSPLPGPPWWMSQRLCPGPSSCQPQTFRRPALGRILMWKPGRSLNVGEGCRRRSKLSPWTGSSDRPPRWTGSPLVRRL